jgi:hypothetical protein
MSLKLGVDFGGVIAERADGLLHPREVSIDRVPPVPGALEAVRKAVRALDGQVWIISKASASTERWTREWLAHYRFLADTGVPGHHLIFVRERGGKAVVCGELGITDFIDDRAEILDSLRGIVPRLYLFGGNHEDPSVTPVFGWSQAISAILGHQDG